MKLKERFSHLNQKLILRVALLICVDALLIAAALLLALLVRFEFDLRGAMEAGFLPVVWKFLPFQLLLTVIIFAIFGLYTSLWAFAGMEEALHIVAAACISALAQYAIIRLSGSYLPKSFPILNALLLSCFVAGERFSYRIIRMELHGRRDARAVRTMLIGAGAAAAIAVADLSRSDRARNRVVCIIDDDPQKQGRKLRGIPIVGTRDDICAMARRYRVQEIILAIPSAGARQKREILSLCQQTGCATKMLPSLAEIASGRVSLKQVRDVRIEDLLGRDSVAVDADEIAGYVEGKCVLVTGAGGSIGSELCRQLARHRLRRLVLLDICEAGICEIQQELRRDHPELPLTALIGSVRDTARLDDIFSAWKPEIIYHAAAHKHVPLMEDSPNEAVKNNVFGTRNLAAAADRWGAERFVLISTDKAVNPTNVMGATKRLCEMIVQSYSRRSQTKFAAVRFGNVLGSSGSVIPLFRRQIELGGPVTVTHPDIIRYFMTIPEAVCLVLQAGAFAQGGEIFVLDMGEPVRIDDLARNMIRLSGYEPDVDIRIEYVGLRPGEKLFEELLMNEEGLRCTANQLIHIGRPLHVDEAEFSAWLDRLWDACQHNSAQIKPLLAQAVPTYHITENRTAGQASPTPAGT